MIPVSHIRRILAVLAVLSLPVAAAPAATSAPQSAGAAALVSASSPDDDRSASDDGGRPASAEVALDPAFEEDDRSRTRLPPVESGPIDRDAPISLSRTAHRTVLFIRVALTPKERLRTAAAHASAPRTGPPFRR